MPSLRRDLPPVARVLDVRGWTNSSVWRLSPRPKRRWRRVVTPYDEVLTLHRARDTRDLSAPSDPDGRLPTDERIGASTAHFAGDGHGHFPREATRGERENAERVATM